jgi:hypothetical protein
MKKASLKKASLFGQDTGFEMTLSECSIGAERGQSSVRFLTDFFFGLARLIMPPGVSR